MSSPETKHQEWIKQVLDESDKEYQAELERQKKLAVEEAEVVKVTEPPVASNLEKL